MFLHNCLAKHIAIIIEQVGFKNQFLKSNFKTVTFNNLIKLSVQVKMFEKTIIIKNPSIPSFGTNKRISVILSIESIVL